MNISLSKKTRKLLVVVLVSLIIIVYPTTFLQHAEAADSGYVIIYSPTAYERYPYWESVNIHYRVVVRSGWLLESSRIFIDGLYKGMYSQSFVNVNIHGLASKIHTLKIEVNCFRARPFDYDQYNTFRTFYTYSATDQDDINDLRIDKLHDLGKAGQGVTICVMVDGLGYNDVINSNYHPSIYKEYSNVIRDVDYFIFDRDSEGDNPSFKKLTSNWDQLSASAKWDAIRNEEDPYRPKNAGNIDHMHGTKVLSVLVQIAPHAKYMFVEHRGNPLKELAAIRWISENDIHIDYSIEVISLFWGDFKSDIDRYLGSIYSWFWGTTYNFDDYETWFDDIANGGGLNQKVITVAPSTNQAKTFSQESNACFPASLSTVIGVTGVYDRDNGDSSWKLRTGDDGACNGYGIDIAGIDYYTTIPWEPDTDIYEIAGTCNAATFVSGITAILKQYYDPLTISQLQEVLKYTGDAEGDSPKNYGTESGGAYESLDPYDESTNFGYYPGNYRIAWGIIDSYETYLYIKDNIMP